MGSIPEVMQLCRLCLMKDDVNNLIFEDEDNISQIFLKISACLPIKVARDDTLPKKICDSCSYKLELLYDFLHTVTTSEKQLITLLKQLEDDPLTKVISHLPLTRIANVAPIVMKQELPDLIDTHSVDDITPSEDLNITVETEDYVLQQQQSPYESVEFEFQQERFIDNNDMNIDDSTTDIGSGAIKRKRQNIALKRLPTDLDSDEYEEDEDNDFELPDSKIAKIEDDSEVEQTPFVHLTSTTSDNDQPGPSGLGKTVGDGSICDDEDIRTDIKKRSIPRSTKKWYCRKCNLYFITSTQLRKHRKTHTKEEQDDIQYNYKYDEVQQLFTCHTCDFESSTKEEIEKHVVFHEQIFACNICSKSFVKPYEYTCHIYNHDKTKNFQCPLCKYNTNRRTAVALHIKTFHLRKYIYTCEECGKGFNDCVTFREHTNIHKGIKPFKCIVCEKEYAFSSYLTQHQIRYHTVLIEGVIGFNECPICSKRFSRKNSLQKHMIQHENDQKTIIREKKHLCDICGQGFKSVDKMRIHYRVHTGIKPYTCSYCSKSFTKRDYLIMHERVHSGEKPYICSHCGKGFSQGAPLRLHLRIHTGERPYTCHLCNNGFISRGVLNIHLKKCPGLPD